MPAQSIANQQIVRHHLVIPNLSPQERQALRQGKHPQNQKLSGKYAEESVGAANRREGGTPEEEHTEYKLALGGKANFPLETGIMSAQMLGKQAALADWRTKVSLGLPATYPLQAPKLAAKLVTTPREIHLPKQGPSTRSILAKIVSDIGGMFGDTRSGAGSSDLTGSANPAVSPGRM